jgi:propanediol dehydratase small subunit
MSRPNPLIPETMAQAVAIAKRVNASWRRPDALPATPEPVADPEVPTVLDAVSTPNSLSTAAQAVLDAFWKQPGDRSALAAAFHAAAAQIAAGEVPHHVTGDVYWPWRNGRATAEEYLHTIATELEGANG